MLSESTFATEALPQNQAATMDRDSLEVQVVDPTGDPEWDSQVFIHPRGSVFHSSGWAQVLMRTYGHSPHYLRFTSEGNLAALVPLMEVQSPITGTRGVGLPFADQCEPLWFESGVKEGVMQAVLKLARSWHWKHLELRGGECPAGMTTSSGSFAAHQLPLLEPKAQFAGLSSATRRAIRKAESYGLRVDFHSSVDTLRQYYALHQETRRRHGAPPQPISFFLHLFDHVIARGNGVIALAYRGARAVAGAVYLRFGRKGVYKFGAQSERHRHLRGSNLVMWRSIQRLQEDGCESLDLGRTSLQNEGLRRFKMGWGCGEATLHYYRISPPSGRLLPAPDRAGGTAAKVFQRLPLELNRILGSILYPHLD